VACKTLSESSSKNDILGEVITGLTISGEKYFPFVFGMLNENAILMEYFGELSQSGLVNSPNLREKVKERCSSKEFQTILYDVLNGVIALHGFQILHNDLKADNFVFSKDCVKLIDFGKATLFSF